MEIKKDVLANPLSNHINDQRLVKRPYSPPVLLLLELDEIAGGVANLQEGDGGGFIS